ncbi:hypothetical protein Q3G72_009649 [Acer saccharum]|nr:hypothetical protein Q3G72_009649 [Acer saccharum]
MCWYDIVSSFNSRASSSKSNFEIFKQKTLNNVLICKLSDFQFESTRHHQFSFMHIFRLLNFSSLGISQDCTIKVWETTQGKLIRELKGNAPERLVSGSDDFTMFLWEPAVSKRMKGHQQPAAENGATGKFVAAFRGHVGPLYQIREVFTVDWSPDGEKVASGGKDRVLKLWMG